MPVVLSYPGVYVEEIPSGQFTITGVATSITAFVGRALCGPIDKPVTLFNFGDYQRIFGGLGYDFPLSYAVQDFFMNGGGQAVVARLFEPSPSAEEWNASAANALQAIQTALTPAAGASFDSAALLKAGATAADGLPGQDKSMVQAMLRTVTASTTPTTTADTFSASVKALSAPSYPGTGAMLLDSTAAIKLDSTGGGDVAAPALAVAIAVVRAAFEPSGNTVSTTATVKDLQAAAATAAGKFQDNPQMKIARAVQKSVGAAGVQTVSQALDASVAAVKPSIATGAGNPAPQGLDLMDQLLARVQQAIDPLFKPAAPAPAGNQPPAPAPAPASASDMATAIDTAIATPALGGDALAAGSSVTAAAKRSAAATGASVVDVIAAALQAAADASFAVPDDQVLALVAADPGSWGKELTATIDIDNITAQSATIFAKSGLNQEDLFNLTVSCRRPNGTTDIERYTNVTVKKIPGKKTPLPNRIDLVLKDQSQYVRVAVDTNQAPLLPAAMPTLASGSAAGGSDGTYLQPSTYAGDQRKKTGIYMLEDVNLFNLLCIPPDDRVGARETDTDVYEEAMAYCVDRRAVLIVDPPLAWSDSYDKGELDSVAVESLHLFGTQTRNAAVYFPRVIKEDLMMNGQLDTFPACGAIAGVIAATDVQRGVWKAPAGQNAGLNNIYGLEFALTDDEQGELNPQGINCLRNLPVLGPVVWGARTLRGADQLSDDFKYLSVRRLALFLEESLYRGTRWAVFEPNDEALWSSLRLAINSFMGDLARQGAFYGFNIKCDKETNTQTNIDKGIVTVLVQYAPVKPAEFVVLQFQQQAGLTPS